MKFIYIEWTQCQKNVSRDPTVPQNNTGLLSYVI